MGRWVMVEDGTIDLISSRKRDAPSGAYPREYAELMYVEDDEPVKRQPKRCGRCHREIKPQYTFCYRCHNYLIVKARIAV
jgi:hypothetical protein